jgi:lipoprotein-anchoring transpeptidase ErfK/SrfK
MTLIYTQCSPFAAQDDAIFLASIFLFTKWSIPPMTLTRYFSGVAIAALTVIGGLASTQPAMAEGLVDFLWGGSAEFGGGRATVSFDPQYKAGQIIVSFSDRRLYLITQQGQAITYPVAVPMGEARWQGVTFVSNKRINPSWTPTPEMVRNNPRLPRWVPGGHPMNPLGVRALYLGSSAYRIHGTDAPWTIGQAVSHGCIRMTNKDVLDLYPRVNVGMRVTVTWQRFSTKPVASSSDYSSSEDNSAADNGGSAPARTNRKVSDGSLGSLFFWQDDPAPAAEQAPAKKKYTSAAVKKTPASGTPSTEKKASSAPAAAKTSAPEKSTDATSSSTPKATKVSASSADNLPVHKASAEVQ